MGATARPRCYCMCFFLHESCVESASASLRDNLKQTRGGPHPTVTCSDSCLS